MIEKKRLILWFGIILGLLVALIFLGLRVPRYNPAGVHPDLLALKEPFGSVKAFYYFDGGSIGVEILDAAGKDLRLALPVNHRYSRLFFGKTHLSERGAVVAEVPFSEDSKRFIAEIIDTYAERGADRNWALLYLRKAPVDRLRVWWEEISFNLN